MSSQYPEQVKDFDTLIEKQPKYIRKSTVEDLDKIVAAINNPKIKKLAVDGINVNVRSLRLKTFGKYGTTCVSCNALGAFFALERQNENVPFHLNLYAQHENGKLLLMTHDHIKPRAIGGLNTIENTQPMCYPCNQMKGHEYYESPEM